MTFSEEAAELHRLEAVATGHLEIPLPYEAVA